LTAHGVKVKAWDKSWAESKKMGSFLSVARGSSEPPVFLELGYSGAPDQKKPIVLVGKFYVCVGNTGFCGYQPNFPWYPENLHFVHCMKWHLDFGFKKKFKVIVMLCWVVMLNLLVFTTLHSITNQET
jgi:hypothetical protein